MDGSPNWNARLASRPWKLIFSEGVLAGHRGTSDAETETDLLGHMACFPMSDSQNAIESSSLRDVACHYRRICGMRPKVILALLKETVFAWSDDNVPRLGASLAFLHVVISRASSDCRRSHCRYRVRKTGGPGQLFWQIRGLVGSEGARTIQELLEGAYKPGTGALAIAFGASSVVVELRDGHVELRRIALHDAAPAPSGGVLDQAY